jgi:hypothetical protein
MRTWALIQGVYFLLTGVWPLISIRTFQAVTGPKVDLWLVKTVGALVAVVGLTIVLAALSGTVGMAILVLSVVSAAALCIVDINYSMKGVISKIYLLDAVIEIAIIAGWIIAVISW